MTRVRLFGLLVLEGKNQIPGVEKTSKMEATSAVELLSGLYYKTGWEFEVSDFSKRHENAIRIAVTYPADRSERNLYPQYGEPIPGGAKAAFIILVGDCNNSRDLYYRLLTHVIMPIEQHEAREFLRVSPTGWAPFHPHRTEGMKRWAEYSELAGVDADIYFGIA